VAICTSDFERELVFTVTESDLQILKASVDKVIRIICFNGETVLAKVHAVSEEDEDVIYDLVLTTKD